MVKTEVIFREVVLAAALSMLAVLVVWLIGGFMSCQGSPKNPTEMLNVNSRTVSIAEAKETEKPKKKKKHKEKKHEEKVEDALHYSSSYFMQMGELYDYDGWRYTWYSENVLPGGGLDIPGRHLDDEGYVVDENGYLTLASEDLEYGTVINVPFGSGVGVVRDCGCPNGTIDIYVGW